MYLNDAVVFLLLTLSKQMLAGNHLKGTRNDKSYRSR